MAKQTSQLKILPVNKSVVFYSPIEGDDVLVRTGTIKEGSCFFHALLHGFSKDYMTMDKNDRMKFVYRLRASLAGKLDRDSWEDMGGGVIAKIPFQENIHEILYNFYRFMDDKKIRGRASRRVIKHLLQNNTENVELYKLITELIPLVEGFEQQILPKAYKETSDERIVDIKKMVIKETKNYLDKTDEIMSISKEKAAHFNNTVANFLTIILKEAEDDAYKTYIKGLENVKSDIDSYSIEFVSERFNRDIYFLDGKTRLPYNTLPTTNNLKGRKSIIVIWINENHYEIVGRLLPGNRIQREFPPQDPLVVKLKTMLLNPQEVKQKYPDLAAFIPKNTDHPNVSPLRKTRHSESDEESDEESDDLSDPYYDKSDAKSTDGSMSD
jgi:hypothetical protein